MIWLHFQFLHDSSKEVELLECAICLQPCVHPVLLPCSHVFCFLCVKGVAIQSKRCALCRQDVPVDFFNNPSLLRREDLLKELSFEDGYQWYYQGVNGWWQYDERASSELEEHYKTGAKHLEILIAGFLYIIDYENMLQYRRNDPSRRRKIKRDVLAIPDKKGIAGLKVASPGPAPHRREGDGGENVPCVVQTKQTSVPVGANDSSPTSPPTFSRSPVALPNTPNNTPEGAHSGTSSPQDLDRNSVISRFADLEIETNHGRQLPSPPVSDTSDSQTSPSSDNHHGNRRNNPRRHLPRPPLSDDEDWQ